MSKLTQRGSKTGLLKAFGLGASLVGVAAFWLAKVNEVVPDPYLDEVFHIRQAQVYCSGDLLTWDPKITTPPGLYLVSWLLFRLTGRCSAGDLRALNLITIALGWLYTYSIVGSIGKRDLTSRTRQDRSSLIAANIWLFPPLFFFSGLYYTDVQSAFWVLLAFQSFLGYQRRGFAQWSDAFSQFKFGIIALLFRQTNIFWIAIFPAGLALIASAEQSSSANLSPGHDQSLLDICKNSWNNMDVYDPPIYEAWLGDYVIAAISLTIVALSNWKKSISVLIPYVSLVACFAGFVVWNGGVVLGDKSNHVATLHLPQMLYLWPYMLFFSWPIVAQSLLLGHIAQPTTFWSMAKQVMLLGSFTAVAVIAIHLNTIVHPFTLADNRHYVFYVFRLLTRHPAIKYLAAPAYIFSAYLIIHTLGASTVVQMRAVKGNEFQTTTVRGRRVSFVIIWTVTTALSLITAPLVEPRYCIVPWIMWRLHVPTLMDRTADEGQMKDTRTKNDGSGIGGLILETLWFLAIFGGTSYTFLLKEFAWPQEPGKVQRFLW